MRIDRNWLATVGTGVCTGVWAAVALLWVAAAPAHAQDLVEIAPIKQPRKLNVQPYPERPAKYVAPPAKKPIAKPLAAKPKPAVAAKSKAKKRR